MQFAFPFKFNSSEPTSLFNGANGQCTLIFESPECPAAMDLIALFQIQF